MVKPPKRASKRQSTKQRAKISKKVREHHRKSRRDAKRSTQWKSKQKADPGIPNSFPYKEQLLDQIQQNREREQQRRLEEERRAELRRNGGVAEEEESEGSEDDDEMVEGEEDEDEDMANLLALSASTRSAPQYEGSLPSLLEDDSIQHLVFALDARDPPAWRCRSVERLAVSKGKQVHLALTRADLVPLEALTSHLHALKGDSQGASSSKATTSVFAVSDSSKESVAALADGIAGASKKNSEVGIAILGLEHSGRSSLASHLLSALSERDATSASTVYDTTHLLPPRRKKSAPAASAEDEEDMDDLSLPAAAEKSREQASSPSDFQQRRNRALVALLRNKGKVEKIGDPVPLIWALMPLVQHNTREDLMFTWNVPAFGSGAPIGAQMDEEEGDDEEEVQHKLLAAEAAKAQADANEFLIGLARQQGRARKGGLPDVSAAARVLLRDWCSGCVGYYSYAEGWMNLSKDERSKLVEQLGKEVEEVTLPRREWKKAFVEHQKARSDLHPSPAVGEVRLKSAGEGAIALGRPTFDGQPFAEDEQEVDDAEAEAEQWQLWAPRVSQAAFDADEDDEDEDDDEDDEEFEGDSDTPSALDFALGSDEEDEELDSDALVPSGDEDIDEEDDDDDDEEELEDEEDVEEESTPVVSHKDRRKAAKQGKSVPAPTPALVSTPKLKAKAKANAAGTKEKKRVRLVEPTKAEKRGRRA
ncbi:hypothetical protein BDZ90DRAFT_280609 [Jaminaea rosea]|uniref:Guanine nucleotide-binding protein-like 3 N-terminal domain-containing protein n=1 Tax=Jaminaea rosea TaxID=1569628 RepID=A0A316UP92_9BASI|nr:hypothetical protein BDZ90DRAFT_280609 [Jaminaea rosea]PWN26588.1 hypothetical protein BDZ90DRAFT_280609 [Jaminaea rosea]